LFVIQQSSWGNIKIVTLAPELFGALDVIPALQQRGAVVSVGHTNTSIDLAEAAIERGASLITHLFNAMSEVVVPLLSPRPHPPRFVSENFVSCCFSDFVVPPPRSRPVWDPGEQRHAPEEIPLLHHLRRDSLTPKLHQDRLLFPPERLTSSLTTIQPSLFLSSKIKQTSFFPFLLFLLSLSRAGAVLVTDAMGAMGLPPGNHQLGTLSVSVEGSKAYLKGTTTLAGSVVTMDECVRNFMKYTGDGPSHWLLSLTGTSQTKTKKIHSSGH